MKTFRSARDKRPPEPFRLEYEVEVVEKIDAPDSETGYELRPTGEWAWESREFGARHGALSAGMTLAINDMDPADPTSGIRQTRAIQDAIRAGIVEHREFMELIGDPRARIAPNVLSEILNYLVEISAARPTNTPGS